MRALLVYPELPLSFWSFKKSVRLAGKKALLPPLGIMTVAALLPPEWELRLIDMNCRKPDEKDWKWADIVLISAMVAQSGGVLSVVEQAKSRGKIVVAGGPYPTSVPGEVLRMGCDFVVCGEAENTIPQFLEALEKEVPPVIITGEGKPDITKSPVPRFDLINTGDYADLSVQTSRGCPFDCEFCDVIALFGRKPRYKDSEQVITELEALYSLGLRGHVFICDDNFIGNKTRARELLGRIVLWNKERKEPFSFGTQASIDLGQDLELIDLMTEANFGDLFIGIETPDEEVLESAGKYQNIRNPIVESIDNICRNGLSVRGSFIIGFDGEKKDAGKRICDIIDATKIPICMLNILHAPPDTKLFHRLEKEGRLVRERANGEDGTFSMPNFVTTRPEAEILSEYVDAWAYLYDPSRFLKRIYEYHLKMRPTRRAMALSKGEAPPSELPDRNPSLRSRIRELYIFFTLLWIQGIRPPYRAQFWRQLIGIWKRNPSRMHIYLSTCVMAEDLLLINEILQKRTLNEQITLSCSS